MPSQNKPSPTPLISVIVPLFNEEASLKWHYGVMTDFFRASKINYELIYINDGSSDKSLEIVQDIAKNDSRVKYISFSRNFGKEAATTAGLRACKGDAAVMIDADGQHPVELIETFYNEWLSGQQVVIGIRESNQGEGFIKSLGSRFFYNLLRLLGTNESTQSGLTDFRLVDRRVIDEFKKLTEHNRVTRNLIDWLGFKRKLIPFHANERHAGQASYTVRKLMKLAIDGVVKHSTRPLKFIGILGGFISFVSIVVGLGLIIEQYALGDPLGLGVTGTAILAIFLSFMIGIILLCQGLLALYLENVYYETQNRPLYVIAEEN